MSLAHFFHEPFYSLSDFDRLFDDAFDARERGPASASRGQAGPLARREQSSLRALRPKMDVHEDRAGNRVRATFELPGLKKDDVHIALHDGVLTVSGEIKRDVEREEDGYAVRERRFGRFERAIPVPRGIKEEEISAALEDGVLSVSFPRAAPESQPRKIAVA